MISNVDFRGVVIQCELARSWGVGFFVIISWSEEMVRGAGSESERKSGSEL